jgi:hypothetical protein
MVISRLLNRDHSLVGSGAWSQGLGLQILAVGHLALEDSVLTGGIELLLPWLIIVVDTWPRVIGPCHVIVLHIVLFENGSLNFRLMKLVLRMLLPDGWLLGVVGGWTNGVMASGSVGGGCQLLSRNRVCDRLWNN